MSHAKNRPVTPARTVIAPDRSRAWPLAVIRAIWAILPHLMHPHAEVFLLAVGWQESRWRWRRQRGGGPARGVLQFEPAGLRAVLAHPTSRPLAILAVETLGYPYESLDKTVPVLWTAVEHNDVLSMALGRLLLWTYPDPLPTTADEAWRQYVALWRPGRPRIETWADAWAWAHGNEEEAHR